MRRSYGKDVAGLVASLARSDARVRGRAVAERSGFEPEVGFNPHTALAMRRFRPLSHLSAVVWRGEGSHTGRIPPRSPQRDDEQPWVRA